MRNIKNFLLLLSITNSLISADLIEQASDEEIANRCFNTHISSLFKIEDDVLLSPLGNPWWFRKIKASEISRQQKLGYLKCLGKVKPKVISKERDSDEVEFKMSAEEVEIRPLPGEKSVRHPLFLKCSKNKKAKDAYCNLMARFEQDCGSLRAADCIYLTDYVDSIANTKGKEAAKLFKSMQYLYDIQNKK